MKRLSVAAPILMTLVMSACEHPNGLPSGCTPETIQERIAGYEGKTGRGIIVKLSDGHVYRKLDDTTVTDPDGIREPFAAGTHVILCPPNTWSPNPSVRKQDYAIAIEIVGRPYEPFQRLR